MTGVQTCALPIFGPLEQAPYYAIEIVSGAIGTKALGLSPFGNVVGSYVDASGDTHGFLVRNPGTKRVVWQTIDDPQASKGTVVTAINLHESIAGYYVDRSGRNHGFLGTANSSR